MQVLLSSLIIISCSGCVHLVIMGILDKGYDMYEHGKLENRIEELEDYINRDPNLL